MQKSRFVFFGSSRFSCLVLDELESAGFLPTLVVTTKNVRKGRGLAMSSPEPRIWADERGVPSFQPSSLKEREVVEKLWAESADVFVVASYGKILQKEVLAIPAHGVLNVHPSLLPKLRGATPIQTAILTERKTGVTIMLVDEKVDHGPIVAQEDVALADWPPYFRELEEILGHAGGRLLAKVLPDWVAGKVTAVKQDHTAATFTRKITEEDVFIDFTQDPEINLRKIRAYSEWQGAYFFVMHAGKKLRVGIRRARVVGDKLIIETVVPEGKKEMSYQDFLRGVR